jgi:hypothetical protein
MTASAKHFTGETIKYPNGHTALVYSQMTKKGLRYYRYSRGRFFMMSRFDVDQLIVNA